MNRVTVKISKRLTYGRALAAALRKARRYFGRFDYRGFKYNSRTGRATFVALLLALLVLPCSAKKPEPRVVGIIPPRCAPTLTCDGPLAVLENGHVECRGHSGVSFACWESTKKGAPLPAPKVEPAAPCEVKP